jgi:hypothetical protein
MSRLGRYFSVKKKNSLDWAEIYLLRQHLTSPDHSSVVLEKSYEKSEIVIAPNINFLLV